MEQDVGFCRALLVTEFVAAVRELSETLKAGHADGRAAFGRAS